MEEILHSITAAGYRQLQGKGLALYRFDPLSGSFPDLWRLENGHIQRRYRTGVNAGGLTTSVLREGRLRVVRDTLVDEGISPFLPDGIRSFVAVPVEVYGVPWGVLYINSAKPDSFADTDLEFVQSLARQIGVFLEASKTDSLGNVELSTVRVLAATVDAKDPYTRNHSTNVAFYARRLAREMNLDPAEVHRIDLAGLLHDIGKIAIPDQILQKPSYLREEERLLIQTHAAIGANILAQASHLYHLVPLVRHHHEWYNGTGYPDRLRGSAIPLGAAIIGLADAFDAMTTPRVYRPAFTLDETVREIQRCSGTQFHPDVVNAFDHVIRKARFVQEPWLAAMGDAQEARNNLGEMHAWQGVRDDQTEPDTPNRDPLDFLAEARLVQQLESLPAILGHSGELALNFWSADAVLIYLADPGDGVLQLAWAEGTPEADRLLTVCREQEAVPMSHGLLGWAVLANQGISISDARRDPRWPYGSDFDGPLSVLVAPITAGGSTIGVMEVAVQGESRFGRSDVKAMKIFGSLVGQAIDRAKTTKDMDVEACTDALTGVRNTNFLNIFLERLDSAKWDGPMSVAFLDGDDVKGWGDRHGQESGRLIIQHIARCISAYLRPDDVLIRYAGDEFLVFFPGLSLPEAGAVLENMRIAISETPLELSDGQRAYASVSCGITEVGPEQGPHKAMRAAEQAMYNAKRTGKNRVWTAAV